MQESVQEAKFKIRSSIECPKVRQFLESKARNSVKTAKSYEAAVVHFDSFLNHRYPQYDVSSVVEGLLKKEIEVYRLLDDFIAFMQNPPADILAKMRVRKRSIASIRQATEAMKSYLTYHDVDIIPLKFKNKVTMPKDRKEDEVPIDKTDARALILAQKGFKMRAFCLALGSAGPRPVETLANRFTDLTFSLSVPIQDILEGKADKFTILDVTKVYMRAEYSKNKLPREIYYSIEATRELIRYLKDKYTTKQRLPKPNDLIWAFYDHSTPDGLYQNFASDFQRNLSIAGLNEKKEGKARHDITLYSFRRFVETTIEDLTSANYADYILGHKKSPYYNHKEPERKELYKQKCSRALTYLDYESLDARQKTIESELHQKDDMIARLSSDLENVKDMVRAMREEMLCQKDEA